MIYREMVPDDAPAAAAIEQTLPGDPWSETAFRESLRRPEAYFITAQTEDGILAGYCGCYMTMDDAEIVDVAVKQSYRRQGIGGALLDQMIQDLAKRGLHVIVLEVRASNEAAIRLYSARGFEKIGVRRNFYNNPREDALIMWRHAAEE